MQKVLKKYLNEICSVSRYKKFNYDNLWDLDDEILSRYTEDSIKRANLFYELLSNMGYSGSEQKFSLNDYARAQKYSKKLISGKNVFFNTGNDRIWLTAHHDYCAGKGAEDNGSGLAVILAIADYFKEKNHNIAFGSFDMEEYNTAGSTWFFENYSKKLHGTIRYALNLDSIGSGKDVLVCSGLNNSKYDKGLIRKLKRHAKKLGWKLPSRTYKDKFSCDAESFYELGIKTTTLTSIDFELVKKYGITLDKNRMDGSIAHTDRDTIKHIRFENLEKITRMLITFLEHETKNYNNNKIFRTNKISIQNKLILC